MAKYCAVCGNEIQNKRNKKFCSYKCAGLYKQNYAVCPVCGKTFKHSPSDTTTHTCGSRECKIKFRKGRIPENSMERAHEAIKANPKTGHFETHHKAVEWHLISPDGIEYHFKNLVLWIEQNEELLPFSQRTGTKVSNKTFFREMQRLKSDCEKHACWQGNYHGWRIKGK